METTLFPRPLLLAKTILDTALTERGKSMKVASKNPSTLPDRWIRLSTNGGPRSPGIWEVQIVSRYFDSDESLADANSGLIHGILMDAAGVAVTLPTGPADFPWVVWTRHVSGPVNLQDEDLPELEVYQSAVVWALHYIP
jgi:hypothetical protein